MFKRLIAAALAVGIAHLGLKFYLYHQIKSEIDDMVKSAAPFAEIQYGEISTSILNQSLSVRDIRILAMGSESPITVEELNLFGANFFSGKSQWFNQKNLDKKTYSGIRLYGLQFKVEDQSFANHPMLQQNPQLSLLSRLGYESFNTDLVLSIKTEPKAKSLELNFEQYHNDMFAIGLKASFVAQTYHNTPTTAEDLQLTSASIEYVDNSFLDKWIRYEAAKQGVTDQDYKQQVIKDLQDKLKANKLELNDRQLTAIANTIKQSHTLKLSIRPSNPMGVQSFSRLKLYTPNDVSQMLNLDITNP